VIAIEDLQIANLLKNRKLAKAISEVSWYQFRTMLEYKARWFLAVAFKTKRGKILAYGTGLAPIATLSGSGM